MEQNVTRDEYGNKQEKWQAHDSSNSGVVSLKEWIITLLIMMIPIVNIVMVFVWAFGGGTNPSKSNYFKATIIVGIAGIVLWFLFVGAFLAPIFNSLY
ncbi:MAG: hypothetical protein BGO41_12165 [Clostridiales bacterium 38-18]|nr:MAG: hypothetical protein BGO41_12165 [Clostridiales bacterium 38-18]